MSFKTNVFLRNITAVFIVSFSVLSGLGGCASSVNLKENYARYVDQFQRETPYIEHTVARADGHLLNAREFGKTNQGKQPTLLMMHGFPDNQHLYDRLVARLAGTRHIITFDFLGWGKSQSPVDMQYPVSTQRQDIEAIAKKFALNNVEVIVHDLSGQPGIDWAMANESKVARLILLNTYYHSMPTLKAPDAIEFYSKPGLLKDIAQWGAMKAPARFEAGVAQQLSQFMVDDSIRQQFLPIFTQSAAFMRPAFFSSVSYLWSEIQTRDQQVSVLRAFKKPVLIIFGTEDPSLNPGVAKEFNLVFSNSSLHLLQGAGHYVQLDQAKAVAQLIQ
jgi:haloalkane dehalogenase